MFANQLKRALRFYFITDDHAAAMHAPDQVRMALRAGATMIQYRNKAFKPRDYAEVETIKRMCRCNDVPLIINDDIILAKALGADGVHVGQADDRPADARAILGDQAIIGVSVSNLHELHNTDLGPCDYIGTGPVFPTSTKADAKAVLTPEGMGALAEAAPVPLVAIGGIDPANAAACFEHGAAGVAVISCITRAHDPEQVAYQLGRCCNCKTRNQLQLAWDDEFGLIQKLAAYAPDSAGHPVLLGDDAALLHPQQYPVITTDVQREGVHFHLNWQTPDEIGFKAAVVALSDLAACYAAPTALFINLTLPHTITVDTIEKIYSGVKRALTYYQCTLGGGNITSGDSLGLNLFAIGEGRPYLFPRRSAAKAGDRLYCTGRLGLARGGLMALRKKDPDFPGLIDKFKAPTVRFGAANALAHHGVRCVMDISDGLAGDAAHIAAASDLTIIFDDLSATAAPELVAFCDKYKFRPEDMIFSGGEDYELLFACPPTLFEFIREALPNVYQVGRCVAREADLLMNVPDGVRSWQHGKG